MSLIGASTRLVSEVQRNSIGAARKRIASTDEGASVLGIARA